MTDYEAERANFHLEVPARFNWVLDVFERRAAANPDSLALLSLDATGAVSARHTWSQLAWVCITILGYDTVPLVK